MGACRRLMLFQWLRWWVMPGDIAIPFIYPHFLASTKMLALIQALLVSQVIGATSPLGARVTACLATHGARLALVGNKDDKEDMAQVHCHTAEGRCTSYE